MTRTPALIGISHGTSSEEGQRAVAGLLDAVARADPDLVVTAGFVDVQRPDPVEALARLERGRSAIIVPLLLSAGYHVHVDLTTAVRAQTERRVVLARPLGPDDRLVRVLRTRLDAAGLGDDDALVLAAAGSSDPRAVADCRDVAARLALEVGREVTLGFLSATKPRLHETVALARTAYPGRRVVVSSYLLAPGYFQDLAEAAGGDRTAAPILVPDTPIPPPVVDVVLDRYWAATTEI